jgi:hypothetical protein
MNKLFSTVAFLLLSMNLGAQDIENNTSILSSSEANNNVVYTLGEIVIDDITGVLAANSFQLFDDGVVQVTEVVNSSIKVYPNPTVNHIQIVSQESISTIQLVDMEGKVVMSRSAQDILDVSSLTPGQYIIIINDEKSLRITKQ